MWLKRKRLGNEGVKYCIAIVSIYYISLYREKGKRKESKSQKEVEKYNEKWNSNWGKEERSKKKFKIFYQVKTQLNNGSFVKKDGKQTCFNFRPMLQTYNPIKTHWF